LSNSLGPEDVRVGHLLDGNDDLLPDQVAVLTFDEQRGATLTVPYFWDSNGVNPQYAKAARWFDLNDPELPSALMFLDERGFVTMSEAYVRASTIGNVMRGKAGAQAVIFGRPRVLRESYQVEQFVSTLDGLDEFAAFRIAIVDREQLLSGTQQVTVTLDSSDSVQWEVGGFSYSIQAAVSWRVGRRLSVDESPARLLTAKEGGASFSEHFLAQSPIRALLVLIHGTPLAWRSHRLRDDEFPTWMMDGSDREAAEVDVQLAGTVGQHGMAPPNTNRFALSVVGLRDLGPAGMCRWIELYAEKDLQRAIQPAVEVLNGASKFLEPQLMMLAISLDHFGFYRFGDGSRRPLSDHILKCLESAQLDWPEIGPRSGIARAIASVNNDLKHPDRRKAPSRDVLLAVTSLAKIVARAQIFDLLGLEERYLHKFLGSNDSAHAVRTFTERGITINDSGHFLGT
jgi:hypothetical protein